MRIPWSTSHATIILFLLAVFTTTKAAAEKKAGNYNEDFGDPFGDELTTTKSTKAAVNDVVNPQNANSVQIPKSMLSCDGIYVSYNFMGREKNFPLVKNTSAQSWAFKSEIHVTNMGITELKSWQVHVGFQYRELIVSIDGGQMLDAHGDYPAKVGKNGTVIAGYPHTDLETGIDTAGDLDKMSAKVTIKGTQFGVGIGRIPMPRIVKLVNDGYKCPTPYKTSKSSMQMCCRKDKKFKQKKVKISKLRTGDLNIMYDIIQANTNNYLAQVTIDNVHPLGRLDHWNLTWEWTRGEFIYNMKGAYTHLKSPSACIYGESGEYYQEFDFSQVTSCERKPVISDLPREKVNDEKVGKIPYCCKNGTILPKTMNESESRAAFQLQVFKLPPDLKRTVIYPPQNWNINGVVNPTYICGPPIRVEPTEFPDPTGLDSVNTAVATWQITCNITKPKPNRNKCCVSFSSYSNDSVVPCNTCACGCPGSDTDDGYVPRDGTVCDAEAPAMLLPSEALLIPFEQRANKSVAWARMKHLPVRHPMPCPDNCGVSVHWHLDSDNRDGWTARITLFNWKDVPLENWFAAVKMKGKVASGFDRAYSFNGTKSEGVAGEDVIFLQGLKGLNYLIAETDGVKPGAPRVPGKQQSVLLFRKKKFNWDLSVSGSDGFPEKIIFNGEECALPTEIPIKIKSGATVTKTSGVLPTVVALLFAWLLIN